mmetsp:Transcript_22736/g.38686  ORF Transcript_22736/g.38686 Transcript_22736/m.38686 type:complete len:241 (+) Transcript_22736:49-771(+)
MNITMETTGLTSICVCVRACLCAFFRCHFFDVYFFILSFCLFVQRSNLDWFVVCPLTIVAESSVGLGFPAMSMGLSHSPLPGVDSSVAPSHGPGSVDFPHFPFSSVGGAIGVSVLSTSLAVTTVELTLVPGTVGPNEGSRSLTLIGMEAPKVDPTIFPTIGTISVPFVEAILPIIGISVGEGGSSVTVPTALKPFSLVNPSTIVPHGPCLVRDTAECLATVPARVAVCVDPRGLSNMVRR